MNADPAAHILARIDHRPWPLPAERWAWRQCWRDLAFLHYPVRADDLKRRLPSGLELQTFDGAAWVGLVPFRMADIAYRGLGAGNHASPQMDVSSTAPTPSRPRGRALFGTFPELNLRTYVSAGGRPGVWFFSLDADSWPFVIGGWALYNLPYHKARMRHVPHGDGVAFLSQRLRGCARFAAHYRSTGPAFTARPGTFEHWAAERYCLYSHCPRRGRLRLEVHHAPWPLHAAEADIRHNTILQAAGLRPLGSPRCHFSEGVEVIAYRARCIDH